MTERQPHLKERLLDDRYEIRQTLGQGSFGTVYLAFDRQLGRQVAIKVLHLMPAMADDFARVRGRLVREAQALSTLNHPGLVQVYRLGFVDEAGPFIVMEYVNGESLSAAIERDGPFSSRDATSLCIQIAGALQHAHAQGILHRDIKPNNILLERLGSESSELRARLVDFGLSSISPGAREDFARLTVTGSFLGTPEYASPEQFRGETLDARADIYSLGLVFFELLTGKPAFDVELREAVSKPLPDLLRADPAAQFPQVLQDILNKATQKDKNERYSSVEELLSDLQNLLPKCGDRKFTTARLQTGQKRAAPKVALVVGAVSALAVGAGIIVVAPIGERPSTKNAVAAAPAVAAKAPNTTPQEVNENLVTAQFAAAYMHPMNKTRVILGTYNRSVEDAIDKAVHATNPREQAELFDKAGALASRYVGEARAMHGQKYVCLGLQELARIYELTHRASDAIPCRVNVEAEYKQYLIKPDVDDRANYECYRIDNLCLLSDDYLTVDIEKSIKCLEEGDKAARRYSIIENDTVGLNTSRALYDHCEWLGDLLGRRGDVDRSLKFYKLQQGFLSTQKESHEALRRVTDKIAQLSKH